MTFTPDPSFSFKDTTGKIVVEFGEYNTTNSMPQLRSRSNTPASDATQASHSRRSTRSHSRAPSYHPTPPSYHPTSPTPNQREAMERGLERERQREEGREQRRLQREQQQRDRQREERPENGHVHEHEGEPEDRREGQPEDEQGGEPEDRQEGEPEDGEEGEPEDGDEEEPEDDRSRSGTPPDYASRDSTPSSAQPPPAWDPLSPAKRKPGKFCCAGWVNLCFMAD